MKVVIEGIVIPEIENGLMFDSVIVEKVEPTRSILGFKAISGYIIFEKKEIEFVAEEIYSLGVRIAKTGLCVSRVDDYPLANGDGKWKAIVKLFSTLEPDNNIINDYVIVESVKPTNLKLGYKEIEGFIEGDTIASVLTKIFLQGTYCGVSFGKYLSGLRVIKIEKT